MRNLLLGATGRTGKLILTEVLNNDYKINILVRDKSKINIENSNLTVYEGLPSSKESLMQASIGCDTIISALNISRNSDFPWSKIRTPVDLLSQTMKNIIELSSDINFKRIIVLSAWGANESKKEIPFWFRWIMDYSNVKYPYLDHERQENILRESNLNWTIVRPVGLTNSKFNKNVLVSFNGIPKPKLIISRLNVAKFVMNILQHNLFINQIPTISEY